MTSEEAIKMLKTEKACVERQGRKQNCNRYCESCDLCMPIEDVIEGYNYAIRALKNEQTDGDLITEIDKLPRIKVGNSNSPTVKYCIDEVLLYDLLERYKAEKTSSWVAVDDYPNEDWECDNCGYTIFGVEEPYRFCPNCGKKMWK